MRLSRLLEDCWEPTHRIFNVRGFSIRREIRLVADAGLNPYNIWALEPSVSVSTLVALAERLNLDTAPI